jgi:hypothetical protein
MNDDQELSNRLDVIERQVALQTEALRRIIEGRWDGADGAAGLIVALVGGQAPEGFAPVPFGRAQP